MSVTVHRYRQCMTGHLYECDVTHSWVCYMVYWMSVWHDPSIFEPFAQVQRVCDMTHWRACDMTPSYVLHDSFECVMWLIHVGDMIYSHVWDMTHSCVRHDTFICVTWSVSVRIMSHPLTNEMHTRIHAHTHSFMCNTWHLHMCDMVRIGWRTHE